VFFYFPANVDFFLNSLLYGRCLSKNFQYFVAKRASLVVRNCCGESNFSVVLKMISECFYEYNITETPPKITKTLFWLFSSKQFFQLQKNNMAASTDN